MNERRKVYWQIVGCGALAGAVGTVVAARVGGDWWQQLAVNLAVAVAISLAAFTAVRATRERRVAR